MVKSGESTVINDEIRQLQVLSGDQEGPLQFDCKGMTKTRVLPVPDALIGVRCDSALAKMLGISRAKATEMIEAHDVVVSNKLADKSTKLHENDKITITIHSHAPHKEPLSDALQIVYEDSDVIVVNKPVGVAAHGSVGWDGPTVLGTLEHRGVHISDYGAPGRKGIVSRLDVGTSGLMLVCKSNMAYVEMRRQFSEHEVEKIYHAVVQGHLKQSKATIDAPIGRDSVSDFRFSVQPSGKTAITHYDVLKRFGPATLVKVNLETGRTHQIRVHFSSIGHPLVGDTMYGANPQLTKTAGLSRQWLHATELKFKHPRTHVWTTVQSSYPNDLMQALNNLQAMDE